MGEGGRLRDLETGPAGEATGWPLDARKVWVGPERGRGACVTSWWGPWKEVVMSAAPGGVWSLVRERERPMGTLPGASGFLRLPLVCRGFTLGQSSN